MTEEKQNLLINIVKELLQRAGFAADVQVATGPEPGLPVVAIESDNNLSMLIGKNGQNLNAFEHLVRLVFYRRTNTQETAADKNLFIVDVNDYRRARTRQILDLAKEAASRVVTTQRAEALLPMSPYERRLVHTELAAYKELQTESIGQEPHRRVVIKPLLI